MTQIDQSMNPAASEPYDHIEHIGRSGRYKRRWLVPGLAAAVLATAGAGWAITRNTTSPTTSISCPASIDGDVSIIHATSGNPIADCAAEWMANRDDAVPTMVAYRLSNGAISVVLDGQPAPEGGTALGPGEGIDTRVIALSEALNHHGSDLRTGCLDRGAAQSAIDSEIARVGLDGWNIVDDDTRPIDSEHPCARAIVEGDLSQVRLVGGVDDTPQSRAADPYRAFAQELDAELAENCALLAEAKDVVSRVAGRTDVTAVTDAPFSVEAGTIQLRTVEEPAADCTRATVEIGGSVLVILRGPTA